MQNRLRENLSAIEERIERAAQTAGRDAAGVKLVVVSKTQPSATVRAAIAAGARVLGENKVREAEDKVADVGRDAAQWHLIGHLQSNKARKAVKIFDLIHTLDSIELAVRLERICKEENRARLPVLIQVDLANEATKNGVSEKDLPALVEYLRTCERLKLDGLMIIPPFADDQEKTRPFFRRLREIRDDVVPDGELSMGMSNDFEAAIEEGATLVRVGTAIFGARL